MDGERTTGWNVAGMDSEGVLRLTEKVKLQDIFFLSFSFQNFKYDSNMAPMLNYYSLLPYELSHTLITGTFQPNISVFVNLEEFNNQIN